MSHIAAVQPGTNLSLHAKNLLRTHDDVMSGRRTPTPPRAVVARSWQRVLQIGLDAGHKNHRDPLGPAELERRRESSPLRWVIKDLVQVLTSVAEASTFLTVVTDADGVVLWRAGSSAVRRQADTLGFSDGAEWTEARVGTNAIGTAIAEQAPVQLFSAEHFEQEQHPWYCTAYPIHDPRTGDFLGVVDVSGPALTLHPAIEALVATVVRMSESQLWRIHEEKLAALRRTAEPLLVACSGPALVVDEHGWVAQHSGVAAPDRIAAPVAGATLAVPGMGVCLPEKLPNGWLVRPAQGRRCVIATLTRSAEPALEVSSGEDTWRTALSDRHADILTLLHRAGPTGLTAAQLSAALYGDAEHTVTVRAEVSRLRRRIGALVSTKPYRIADGVTLAVLARQ